MLFHQLHKPVYLCSCPFPVCKIRPEDIAVPIVNLSACQPCVRVFDKVLDLLPVPCPICLHPKDHLDVVFWAEFGPPSSCYAFLLNLALVHFIVSLPRPVVKIRALKAWKIVLYRDSVA
jgi:hypothetical protein